MKQVIVLVAIGWFVLGATQLHAGHRATPRYSPRLDTTPGLSRDAGEPDARHRASSSLEDTTLLADYTFEFMGECSDQGWTSVDLTEQLDVYFHVDDFAGLGGGTFGRLNPLDGTQSLWCGARQQITQTLCGYATLPGYGNFWNQAFCSKNCLGVDTAAVVIDFLISWDSEPSYDRTRIEFDKCDGQWIELASYDGVGSGVESITIPSSQHDGLVRVRFRFESDRAWSDQDGQWDSDGAVIIDNVTASGMWGVILQTETFETSSVGDTQTNEWEACNPAGYGDFAAVYPMVSVLQEDPCQSNLACAWAFFSGSTDSYVCGGWPAQPAVPYQNSQGQYIANEVWSPQITWTGSGTHAVLEFDVYRDLPYDELVFYVWHVRSWLSGCPGQWRDRGFVYYGSEPGDDVDNHREWFRRQEAFGDLVQTGAEAIQIALGCWDMCEYWCGSLGSGDCHSHAPLFDNVRAFRTTRQGPLWDVITLNLFQDNFASDGTTSGTVRADIARDLLPAWNPVILPGDSAVVNVSDPDHGVATDPYTGFGPAVYAYVSVCPQNQAGKTGAQLTGDGFRFPVVDSLSHGGSKWYCVRMDTSFRDAGRNGPEIDQFCVDLNDNLFTPGDTVKFVFGAVNGAAHTTYWSEFVGTTDIMADAFDEPMEFTCLPAGGWLRGGDMLYVDVADGMGSQPFFERSLADLGFLEYTDRYDVRGPTWKAGNRPGGRVKDVQNQLLGCYQTIIWSSGQLTTGTIGDGTVSPDKSEDAAMLFAYLNGHDNDVGGLYLTGDDIARELSQLGGSAVDLRSSFISYTLSEDDHQLAGLGINPTLAGDDGGCFDHPSGNDQWVVFGGCPSVRNFDVVAPAGTAFLEAHYANGAMTAGAIVSQQTATINGLARVLLSGASFDRISNATPEVVDPARMHHLRDALTWLGYDITSSVGGTPFRNYLAPSYPNPFNPTTTIRFELRKKSRVRLRVYNVAGETVATLLDDVREPGIVHVVKWDGRNGRGQPVASGVYFYRLTTKDYTETRKMVLLK